MGNKYEKMSTDKLIVERDRLKKLKNAYTHTTLYGKSRGVHYIRALIVEELRAVNKELDKRQLQADTDFKERLTKIVNIN